MGLVTPKFAVLDSATLVKLARDFWNADEAHRAKARRFLTELTDRSVHIALTFTHISELFRHPNIAVVVDRLRLLRAVKLIAWLRPYDRHWFPGSIIDVLRRELHARVNDSATSWSEIMAKVRADLWETGVGSDMFDENNPVWPLIHGQGMKHLNHERYVASLARAHPGDTTKLRLADAAKMPRRPKDERLDYARRLALDMKAHLDRHGDERLESTDAIAREFALGTLREVEAAEALGGDIMDRLAESHGIPKELLRPKMTVGELGELAAYARRLRQISSSLKPPAAVDVKTVPIDALPTHAFERALAAFQEKSERASGSDLNDIHIATLILYADAVEVDKRTFEYLTLKRANPRLAEVMRAFFRSADYLNLIEQIDLAGGA